MYNLLVDALNLDNDRCSNKVLLEQK